MCRSRGEPPTPRDDIDIIEFDEGSEHIWLDLVSWRYGLSDESSPYLRDVYRAGLREGTGGLVALVDGTPASKAAMHVAEGVAGIYGVATTEAGRGKGLATHLCATALASARATGAESRCGRVCRSATRCSERFLPGHEQLVGADEEAADLG